MPTGTWTAPPDKAVDEALTEQNWDSHLKGNLEYLKSATDELIDGIAYAEITTTVTITTGSEAAPQDIITLPQFTLAAAAEVVVELVASRVKVSAGSGVNVWDGANDLGRLLPSGGEDVVSLNARARLSLLAGVHNIKIRGWGDANNLVINAGTGGAGQYRPAWARVTPA